MKIKTFITVFFIFFSFSLFGSSEKEKGKSIYDRYCTACHSPSMASLFNSPAAHDVTAWNDRKTDVLNRATDKSSTNSIKELVKSAINGTDKGMPPKGTCSDCDDHDLECAIKFMSSSE